MTLIFIGSTGVGAPRNTSRILGPLIRWLVPSISKEKEEAIIYSIRKSAHATEYAVLCLLVWRARRQGKPLAETGWRWSDAIFAIVISALYAASDELHQYIGSKYGSQRQGSPWDVMIDTCGAIGAMVFLRLLGRWLRRW